ncbi:DUF4279 domain-containing protein [Niabella hibiscisoli]|uniref:DUF4279 domain-containing protein n=1 Tax=Niabella hibiscisoli TaxID=1825928 RepID=UPI001F106185|nr:DUF4279 domain-containing protein [Niabella hibiscisoli]MCH5719813.1 DUF4279 domain-containing protein [Niabella hibiscisoli]
MNNEQFIHIAESEFATPAWEVTRQYLAIHGPAYLDEKLSIARIDREREDGLAVVYVPVVGERFYFAVYIDTITQQITSVGTEANHRVSFKAFSNELSLRDMQNMTLLQATHCWNKGDQKPNTYLNYSYSFIEIQPNPEPDEFEDKLKKLLDRLEVDADGIRQLAQKAGGYIQVSSDIHNGNGLIGGFHITAVQMARMAALGLNIDIDQCVSGKRFPEE